MSNPEFTHIYELTDGHFYYIGKANKPSRRFEEHVQWAKRGDPTEKYDFIRSVIADGREHKLELNIIETVPYDNWPSREKYWIKHYRKTYGEARVLNEADGGNAPMIAASGEDHGNCQYPDSTIDDIKSMAEDQYTCREIADALEISYQYVYGIVTGRRRGNAVENANIAQYLDEDTSYEILVDHHYNGLETKELMAKYDKSRSAIRLAIFQEYFQFDEFPIPEKRARRKQENRSWNTIFQIRMMNSRGVEPKRIEYPGSNPNVTRRYLKNDLREDPNWDQVNRVYTGPPKGWEEDWGDWSTSSV